MRDIENYTKGFIVGDAMGVPHEFNTRDFMKKHPCYKMNAFGTHNQPAGTWSDDTSMLLATMDGIGKTSINFEKIMDNFIKWEKYGKYTAGNKVFDIGNTTSRALAKYRIGEDIATCGCKGEFENGNGSLMRIAPITFFLRKNYGENFLENKEAYSYIAALSELTHAHMTSIIGCGFYVSIMNEIINNKNNNISKIEIIQIACNKIFKTKDFGISDSIEIYDFLQNINDVKQLQECDIKSSGYVVHTLLSVIWLFLNCSSTKEAIIAGINLGDDTDTIGALIGGLYNLYNCDNEIDEMYNNEIVNKELANEITMKFAKKMIIKRCI